MTALFTATALLAACGDDSGDDDENGLASGGTGGTGSGKGGNGATGNIDIGQGGNDSGGADNGFAGAPQCGESPFDADPIPVNILMVIDKSGSMDADLGAGSRWDAMETAINSAVDGSMASISYGLLLYPDDASCGVPGNLNVDVQAGTDASGPISDALADVTPSGSTPTASALAVAQEYFENGDGAALEGLKYVLLATDGGPNCHDGGGACDAEQCTPNIEEAANPGSFPACTAAVNCCEFDETQCLDDADTVAAVTALEALGVKTIVIGIPGTEAYADVLNQAAEAGGSPNPDAPPSYYAVEDGDATGLQDVLESITTGLIKDCEFQLQEEPPSRSLLNVEVDGERLLRDDPNGWELDTSTDPPTVVLVGDACDTVKTEGANSVSVLYGCPSDIPK